MKSFCSVNPWNLRVDERFLTGEQGKKFSNHTATRYPYFHCFHCWQKLDGWSSRTRTRSYSALLLTAAGRCKNRLLRLATKQRQQYKGTEFQKYEPAGPSSWLVTDASPDFPVWPLTVLWGVPLVFLLAPNTRFPAVRRWTRRPHQPRRHQRLTVRCETHVWPLTKFHSACF